MRARAYDTGYPPRSLLGKLVEEGPGAGSNRFYQHIPQMLEGEARDVSIAVQQMFSTMAMEDPCIVVVAHYLFRGKAVEKAKSLQMDLQKYWRNLHSAHSYIAACIEAPQKKSA